MKITNLLLLSMAAVFFSCGDEDDDPKATGQDLVGTWSVTHIDYSGSSKTTVQGTSFTADFTGTGKDMAFTTTFHANPQTVISQGSYTIELTTTFMGQTTTEDYPSDEILSNGTWALNGNKLLITEANVTQEATIVEMSSTTLKVKIDLSESETDAGVSVETNIHATYTFKKQ